LFLETTEALLPPVNASTIDDAILPILDLLTGDYSVSLLSLSASNFCFYYPRLLLLIAYYLLSKGRNFLIYDTCTLI
jgi:hypothetical protein